MKMYVKSFYKILEWKINESKLVSQNANFKKVMNSMQIF